MVAPLAGANALSKSPTPFPIEAPVDAKATHAPKGNRGLGLQPVPGNGDESETRSFDQILGALLDKVERAGREGERATLSRPNERDESRADSKQDTRGPPRPARNDTPRSERPDRTERSDRNGKSDRTDDERDPGDGETMEDARNGKRASRRRALATDDIPQAVFLGIPGPGDFGANGAQSAHACITSSDTLGLVRGWQNGAFAHETSVTGTFNALALGEAGQQNSMAATDFGHPGPVTKNELRAPGLSEASEKSVALDGLALQQGGAVGTPFGFSQGVSGLASNNGTRGLLNPLVAQSEWGTNTPAFGMDSVRGPADPLAGAPRFDSVEATFIGMEDGLPVTAVALRETQVRGAPAVIGRNGSDAVTLALAASQGPGLSEHAALDAARASNGLSLLRTEMSRTVVMSTLPQTQALATSSDNAGISKNVLDGQGAAGLPSQLKFTQREVTVALSGEAGNGALASGGSPALEATAQGNTGDLSLVQSQARANSSDLTSRIFLPRRDMAALHADIATLRAQTKGPTYTDEDVLTDVGLALAFSATSQSNGTGEGRGANGPTQAGGSPTGDFGSAFQLSQGGPQLDFSNRGGGQGGGQSDGKGRGETPFFARDSRSSEERTLGRVNENGAPLQPFSTGAAGHPQGSSAPSSGALTGAGMKTSEADDAAAARAMSQATFERAQDRAADLQARGGGMAKVQIRDARLGDVGLRVNMGGDGKVHVEISTADERVKKEIEKGLDELKASLEKNNLQVGEVKVIDDAGRTQDGTRDQGAQQQSQNSWQGSAANSDQNGRAFFNQQGTGRDGRDGTSGTDGGLANSAYGQKKAAAAENSAGEVRQRNVQRGNNGSLKVFA